MRKLHGYWPAVAGLFAAVVICGCGSSKSSSGRSSTPPTTVTTSSVTFSSTSSAPTSAATAAEPGPSSSTSTDATASAQGTTNPPFCQQLVNAAAVASPNAVTLPFSYFVTKASLIAENSGPSGGTDQAAAKVLDEQLTEGGYTCLYGPSSNAADSVQIEVDHFEHPISEAEYKTTGDFSIPQVSEVSGLGVWALFLNSSVTDLIVASGDNVVTIHVVAPASENTYRSAAVTLLSDLA
jgi:hypothetical protein